MKNSPFRIAIFAVVALSGCQTSTVPLAKNTVGLPIDHRNEVALADADALAINTGHTVPIAVDRIVADATATNAMATHNAPASLVDAPAVNATSVASIVSTDSEIQLMSATTELADGESIETAELTYDLVEMTAPPVTPPALDAASNGPSDVPPQPASAADTNNSSEGFGRAATESVAPYNSSDRSTTQSIDSIDLDDVENSFPINLPTVLRLVGSQNLSVQLATERIQEAEAKVASAEAMWLPSLNVGLGYTKHDGQIQATDGSVVDISRNSLFLGGGAKVANAPLAGGAGGPSRFQVDLSLADALFKPLVARQMSCAARYRRAADLNNAELEATLAYYDLVNAQAEASAIRENLTDALTLLETTRAFIDAGKAAEAEITRIEIVISKQRQTLVDAKLRMQLASAELTRIIRLDPEQSAGTLLFSAENQLMPVELIPAHYDLNSLIAMGRQARPELSELGSIQQARLADARSTELRPFIPNLNTGVSTGVFGGGAGSNIDGLDGRADFDVQLIWEVRNLGFGEMAARAERNSQYQQTVLQGARMKDVITAEVKRAWYKGQAARKKMQLAEDNVTEAQKGLTSNIDRIEGLEGLPIEAIQALTALASARLDYLRAVVMFNKSQAELVRGVGQPVQ